MKQEPIALGDTERGLINNVAFSPDGKWMPLYKKQKRQKNVTFLQL